LLAKKLLSAKSNASDAAVAASERDTQVASSQSIRLTQQPSQALVTEVNDVFKLNNSALQFQLDQDAAKWCFI
jgi:hypothetical protein